MKKFFAILLSAMLMLSLAVPAMATDITISGGVNGSVYAAYKLLNATHNPGDAGEDDDLFAYTLNSKYTAVLKSVTGESEQAAIIKYISGLNDDGIRDFADAVYAAIKTAGLTADYTTDDDTFEDVNQGYYLIAETAVGNTADTFSLVMLDTAGDETITVKTKEDRPTVEKQVEEVNDSTGESSWGDSADHDVGDVINYVITGTVSSKYADYKSYDYKFTDTMDAGLTYNQDVKVYVVNGDSKTEVQFAIENLNNGFTAYADLTKLSNVTINENTTIVVEYSATLNENAVSGTTGNKNKVVLEYENDPYAESDGEPGGKTPEDINVVFTYDVIVDKVDKSGNALEGAGFTLYKWDFEDNDWVAIGDEITGVTTFNFSKLDAGKYKLAETKVPDGYNKADDVEFEIVSTLKGETLTGLEVTPSDKFTVTLTSGKIETDVVNNAGTELPETGGMGTTIFYIVGGVMVVAAVVLLITKKRMSAEG